MKRKSSKPAFVVCVGNRGYPASLIIRRIYEKVPDAEAESHGLVRVVDESDEDYLYPQKLFAPIQLPKPIAKAIAT